VIDKELRQLLVTAPVPDELDAQRRAWHVVRNAYDDREHVPVRRGRRLRPLLALAAAAVLALAAVVSPVGGWIRDRVTGEEAAPEPALVRLPAPGPLLVVSDRGPWVVQPDGSKRLLGGYDDASWSPSGRFVIVADDQRITAVEPDGDARWSLTRGQRLADPRWAPLPGERVAYRAGSTLRVVDGNGTDDRLLARGVAAVAPAWRPRPRGEYVLAYADARGRVHIVDVDTRRELWRADPGARVTELLWSADGRLLALTAGSDHPLYNARGRVAARLEDEVERASFGPRGHELAYSSREGEQAVVRLWDGRRTRTLAELRGRFGDVEWSPNGRWLLVGRPDPDEWLFLRLGGAGGVETVEDVRREFDPGGEGIGPFPRVAGWCC
jgi:WD40 repeat protein